MIGTGAGRLLARSCMNSWMTEGAFGPHHLNGRGGNGNASWILLANPDACIERSDRIADGDVRPVNRYRAGHNGIKHTPGTQIRFVGAGKKRHGSVRDASPQLSSPRGCDPSSSFHH